VAVSWCRRFHLFVVLPPPPRGVAATPFVGDATDAFLPPKMPDLAFSSAGPFVVDCRLIDWRAVSSWAEEERLASVGGLGGSSMAGGFL